MPTTAQESRKVIEICRKYVKLDVLAVLFDELWNEIGAASENDSVRQSIESMRYIVQQATRPAACSPLPDAGSSP